MNPNWLIIFLGLGTMLLELLIGIEAGFDLVLIGTALIAGGTVGNMADSWIIGLMTTTVLTILYIVFGRRYVRHKLKAEVTHTNVASLIGKTGRVEKKITPSRAGQVRIGAEIWRAVSDTTLDPGETITIRQVTGVTLHVVKYK